jgi:hypothetical protein
VVALSHNVAPELFAGAVAPPISNLVEGADLDRSRPPEAPEAERTLCCVDPVENSHRPGLIRVRVAPHEDNREEPDMAGKKRPKLLTQTEKKLPAKPKRPRKTSRGK